jgi:hypothetical protein
MITTLLFVGTLLQQADTARLTRIELVVDGRTWSDLKASTFLPEAYGAGYLAGPAEVRLCDRLGCLVLVPADSGAGRLPGDLTFGVQPIAGSTLAERLRDAAADRVRMVIADPPAPPQPMQQDSLPVVYFVNAGRFLVPPAAIARLDGWFRSAGADVVREGEGLVVQFPDQAFRIMPAYGEPGLAALTLYLRREVPGNPTFRFGHLNRLRFGPGRTATWEF